jgi:hypothetical protein
VIASYPFINDSGKVIYVRCHYLKESVTRKGQVFKRVTGSMYGALAGGVFTNAIPDKHRAVNMHESVRATRLLSITFTTSPTRTARPTRRWFVKERPRPVK